MLRSRLTASIYVLLIFLSGIVVGAFGYRLYNPAPVGTTAAYRNSPEEWRKHYISELRAKVKLNDHQVEQLQSILDATRQKVRAVRDRIDPEMKQIHQGQVDRIRAMLSENQLPAYEKFLEERERERQRQQGKK